MQTVLDLGDGTVVAVLTDDEVALLDTLARKRMRDHDTGDPYVSLPPTPYGLIGAYDADDVYDDLAE